MALTGNNIIAHLWMRMLQIKRHVRLWPNFQAILKQKMLKKSNFLVEEERYVLELLMFWKSYLLKMNYTILRFIDITFFGYSNTLLNLGYKTFFLQIFNLKTNKCISSTNAVASQKKKSWQKKGTVYCTNGKVYWIFNGSIYICSIYWWYHVFTYQEIARNLLFQFVLYCRYLALKKGSV